MKNVESSKQGKTQHPRKSICDFGEVWRSVHPLTKRTKLQLLCFLWCWCSDCREKACLTWITFHKGFFSWLPLNWSEICFGSMRVWDRLKTGVSCQKCESWQPSQRLWRSAAQTLSRWSDVGLRGWVLQIFFAAGTFPVKAERVSHCSH